MEQKPYTKKMIKQKIETISVAINEIIHRGGVVCDSALYAYLDAAQYNITNAVLHVKEFNDEFERIIVKQDQ